MRFRKTAGLTASFRAHVYIVSLLTYLLSVLSLSLGFLSVLYCCLIYGHLLSCIGLCFVRFLSLGWCGLVLSTSATDCKDSSPKWPIMTLFNTCLIRDGNINCGNNCGNKRLDTFTLLCGGTDNVGRPSLEQKRQPWMCAYNRRTRKWPRPRKDDLTRPKNFSPRPGRQI